MSKKLKEQKVDEEVESVLRLIRSPAFRKQVTRRIRRENEQFIETEKSLRPTLADLQEEYCKTY